MVTNQENVAELGTWTSRSVAMKWIGAIVVVDRVTGDNKAGMGESRIMRVRNDGDG